MRLTKRTDASGSKRRWPELALLLWLFLVALTGAASAQSTDPQAPTPLTAGEISGGEIEERAVYYFTFEAGPGEVNAALEAKMKKGSKGASVGVELLDAGARSLASALVSGGLDAGRERVENELFKQLGKLTSAADSLGGDGTKRKTARVKVKARQTLLLRLTVDKGVESFTLRVGGAVEFAPYGGESDATTPTDASGATPADQTTMVEQTTAVEQTQPAEPTQSSEQTPTTSGESPVPTAGEAQPTSARPVVLLPGKRPALVRITAGQSPQSPAPPAPRPVVLKIPGKQAPAQQQQQPQTQTGAKPAAIRIPSKKQP